MLPRHLAITARDGDLLVGMARLSDFAYVGYLADLAGPRGAPAPRHGAALIQNPRTDGLALHASLLLSRAESGRLLSKDGLYPT